MHPLGRVKREMAEFVGDREPLARLSMALVDTDDRRVLIFPNKKTRESFLIRRLGNPGTAKIYNSIDRNRRSGDSIVLQQLSDETSY